MRRTLTLLTWLSSTLTFAAAFEGHARLWVGPGFDSNAQREFVSSGVATRADGFLFALAQLDGLLLVGERFRFAGTYDASGRKFLTQGSEDTVVQSAQLEGTVSFANFFAAGLTGRARDRRGANRDYTDLQGGLVVDFVPDEAVEVRLSVNAHRFLYYNRFAYSFWGPDVGLVARYRFLRRHSLVFSGFVNPRTYNATARAPPDEEGLSADTGVVRADAVFGASLGYAYRGPFHVSLTYGYFDQTSSSYGETVRRHRVSATAGVRLPWKLTVLGSLTFQPSLFPDGVYLNPDLTIVEDDENVSSLTVKVVRPITSWLELDVRYAGYLGFYPQNDFLYLRHVVSVGVAVSY